MRTIYSLGIFALVAAAATTAKANLIINPALSSSVTPPTSLNLVYISNSLNSSALGGWTISKGTVDIVTSRYWQLPAGVLFSVDLIGTPNATGTGGIGGIQQIIEATEPGKQYLLTWDFSVNPERPTMPGTFDETVDTKVMKVTAFGEDGEELNSKTVSLAAGTRTRQNMQWIQDSLSFIADGITKIRFEALDPLNMPIGMTAANAYTGPVVANIGLDLQGGGDGPPDGGSVPEPASLAVLGLGGALLLRRRSRA